jgi:hypothetical protein
MKYLVTKYTCFVGTKMTISQACNEVTDSIEEFRKIVHELVECDTVGLDYKEIDKSELPIN